MERECIWRQTILVINRYPFSADVHCRQGVPPTKRIIILDCQCASYRNWVCVFALFQRDIEAILPVNNQAHWTSISIGDDQDYRISGLTARHNEANRKADSDGRENTCDPVNV